MKRIGLVFLPLMWLAFPLQAAQDWNTVKTDHFILYIEGSEDAFSAQVLHKAEKSYEEIAGAMAYARRDDFWLWDNRCRIYLHADRDLYLSRTGQAAWSGGFAIPQKKKIISYRNAPDFIESILPHEMAHLIFRELVGQDKPNVPLWVEEGLAMAQEKSKHEELDHLVRTMVQKKRQIPLKTLSQVRNLAGLETAQAAAFYAQSQSLVRFLLTAKPSGFALLCKSLRDGKIIEDALRQSYDREFEDLEDLEQKWAAKLSRLSN